MSYNTHMTANCLTLRGCQEFLGLFHDLGSPRTEDIRDILWGCAYRPFLVSHSTLRGLVLARGLTQRTSRGGWFFTSGEFLRALLTDSAIVVGDEGLASRGFSRSRSPDICGMWS